MRITFLGAVREVTGSMHRVETKGGRVLLDCGMFQGRRRESAEKNRKMPVDPAAVDTVVLSHAHIDHSGRIPVLTKDSFGGRVVCTRATADACEFLLRDAGHIQESDAEYLNYKAVRNHINQLQAHDRSDEELSRLKGLLKKGKDKLDLEKIQEVASRYGVETIDPLYTVADAEHALTFLEGFPYKHEITITKDMTCRFYDAGHILGSAITIIRARENGRTLTIGFTGDLGRFGKPIINDPTRSFDPQDRNLDLLIMESTYGDRTHDPVSGMKQRLGRVVRETLDRGGSLIIPSFAFGRTQELLYTLHELYNENALPKVPVWVDSPLAINLTRVFGEHPEVYDEKAHDTFLEKGQNPFSFPQVRFSNTVEQSMALMRENNPHIVIASSGMCEGGRILHHLRYKIHNPNNTILVVGFMAKHTLGRRMLDEGMAYEEAGREGPAPQMRFYGKEYPLRAHVAYLDGFSAHADKNELMRFLTESDLKVKKIAVVHGEESQSLAFAQALNQGGFSAFVPEPGKPVEVG